MKMYLKEKVLRFEMFLTMYNFLTIGRNEKKVLPIYFFNLNFAVALYDFLTLFSGITFE